MQTKITFDLADPAGILYFANVFHLAHKNIEYYLDSEYNLWDEWFNNNNYGAPIKHTNADYFKPMVLGHDYQINSKATDKSDSTITFTTEFVNKNNELCAKVKTVHIFVTKPEMKKTNVPDKILNVLFK